MANHLKGEVEVAVPGREKPLVFRLGVNEMIELQNALGMAGQDTDFLHVFDESRLRTLKTVRAVALYGLRKHQPDLTEEQAGDIVVEIGLIRMGGVIREALRWALADPAEKDADAGEAGEPRPSPGPPSS
jgi:hypothetical protein